MPPKPLKTPLFPPPPATVEEALAPPPPARLPSIPPNVPVPAGSRLPTPPPLPAQPPAKAPPRPSNAPPRPPSHAPPRPGPAQPQAAPRPSSPPPLPAGAQAPPRARPEVVAVPVKRVGTVKVGLPAYQTPLAAGMDLPAAIEGPLSIAPLARVLVPTGIAIALPPGFEAQVRPRSGLAWSRGLTVLNSPGTIDADYRGEIKVLLVNLGTDEVMVEPGERIAQLVVARHAHADLRLVDELDDTSRGSGGYGSTGV